MTNQEVRSLIFTAEKAGERKDLPGVLKTILHVLRAMLALPVWVKWGIPNKWLIAIAALIQVIEGLMNEEN